MSLNKRTAIGSGPSTAYFIADLHLVPGQTESTQLALAFFEQLTGKQALFILGDLFEYWIGDDAGLQMYSEVVDALAALSQTGCQITLMHGNRDFLLGHRFAHLTGATLVTDDELPLTINSRQLLLMHGDTLCTDDAEYQQFRARVRSADWQQAFLSASIDERVNQARHLREQSRDRSAAKQPEIMDVNRQAVQARMLGHQCDILVHGHTHRPDVHLNEVRGRQRFVLGDWHADHAIYGVSDVEGFHLREFRGQLCTQVPSA